MYRNQIIIWISIDDVLRPLPAILDTGHGHNLSIGEGQLKRWSGASLKRIGELEIGHQRVVQYAAEVRVHRNVPGRAALRGDSYPLEMPQGISVFEDAGCTAPTADRTEDDRRQQAHACDRRRSSAGNAEDEGLALTGSPNWAHGSSHLESGILVALSRLPRPRGAWDRLGSHEGPEIAGHPAFSPPLSGRRTKQNAPTHTPPASVQDELFTTPGAGSRTPKLARRRLTPLRRPL